MTYFDDAEDRNKRFSVRPRPPRPKRDKPDETEPREPDYGGASASERLERDSFDADRGAR